MNKEVKRMLKPCGNCGHAEAAHQRINIRTKKHTSASCNICKQSDKSCSKFVEK